MKLPKISSKVVQSYWHAYFGIALTYASDYAFKLLNTDHPVFHPSFFGWGLLGALAAPATRALVAKFPFLSPLALRITTKLAKESGTPVNEVQLPASAEGIASGLTTVVEAVVTKAEPTN